MSKKGFTLIELLVVVAIIAVLSTMGFAVYSGIQINARDARRKGDVDAISTALEVHFRDAVNCGSTSTTPYCASADNGNFYSGGAMPTNPTPGGENYHVTIPAARTTYTVCALLESANGNSSTVGDGTSFTAASGASATYYCRRNQQ